MYLPDWTTTQWIAFTGVTVAGLAAITLLAMAVHAVRSWTAPAHPDPIAAPARAPRPTLQLATARLSDAEMDDFERRFRESIRTAAYQTIVIDPTDDVLEHLAPGPGSLTSLLDAGPGHAGERVELVDADVRGWFAEAFDRPPHVPSRTEAGVLDEGGALTQFRARIESAMRTAHLWEIQGRGLFGHDSARTALDHWRINTPTGEYAIVPTAVGSAMALSFS